METPEKNIPESIYWCHEMAMRTLNWLGFVVGNFDPDAVSRQKDFSGIWSKVGNTAKQISYLRDEYLEWSEYQEDISRFDSTQHAPVRLCGNFGPSAHALLDTLVRDVLNRTWGKITPWNPRNRSPEEMGWPDSQRLAKADLDEIAHAIQGRPNGQATDFSLDMDHVNWLEAALKQEYARLIQTLPNSEEQTTASTAEPKPADPPLPPQAASAEEVGRLLHLLGDGDGIKILAIARNELRTAEQRMIDLVRVDQRHDGYNSVQWGELLAVDPAAIRQTDFWKDRKNRKELGYGTLVRDDER
ncbi:MAG: hypothetical protein WCJ35_20540 [Planctomycetota bacterium]